MRKVIEIPAEPAAADDLPPLLKGFGAVPPLVTDINLSLDDRFLYVSCLGTGELKQFDVSDPFNPVETGSVRLGGIVRRQEHPARPGQPLNGAPQMVEISRDGKRVYVTNSLYRTWDDQFYPDGIKGWLAKIDVRPNGGIELDHAGFVRVRRDAAAPGPPGGRRRQLRFLLLRVRVCHDERDATTSWAMLWRSAPFMASIPEWAGCLRWRSGCRSAAAAQCFGRSCLLGAGEGFAFAVPGFSCVLLPGRESSL